MSDPPGLPRSSPAAAVSAACCPRVRARWRVARGGRSRVGTRRAPARAPRRAGSRRRRRRAAAPPRSSCVNAGRRCARNARSRTERPGSSKRWRSWCVPSWSPATRSFRYSAAHETRPGSSGSCVLAKRFETPRGRDHDDHRDVGLQHRTYVPDARSLERRRRDEREQARHLRQHLCRRLERRLDFGAHGELQAERGGARVELRQQLVGVEAVASSVGTRPADVCGCVRTPRDSSSASSARTVDAETSRPPRSTSVLEPTGSLVSTCASTTWRRIAFCRVVNCRSGRICRNFIGSCGCDRRRSREQLGGHAAAEEAPSLGQRERALRPRLS